MIIQCEIDWPIRRDWWWWKPGMFRSCVGGKRYTRIWWLCFGVVFWNGDAKEFGDALRESEWFDTTGKVYR